MTHGMSTTRQYKIRVAMLERCYYKNAASYRNYGGKGITVCDRWVASFQNFWEDMKQGYSDNLTIDRIDSSKGYYKENCRWVSMKTQGNNRCNNKSLTHNGKTKTVSEWAEYLNLNTQTIFSRLNSLWSIEKTLTTPARSSSRNKKRPRT